MSTLVKLILVGWVATVLIGGYGWFQKYYWRHRAIQAETQQAILEVEVAKKKIEAEYAPKIEPIKEISKRRTPKKIKPVVIEKTPPPQVDATDWNDAVFVAQSINRMWGR